MLRSLILHRLDREEKRLGASLDYLRHILRTSLGAFFKFAKIIPFASYRRVLPSDAHAVAGLIATRAEDCGTCLQIGVNLARQEGVSPEVLRAVLDRRPADLSAPLADVYRFTEEVLAASYAESALRDRVRSHYGERGLIELSYVIASARIFPVVKRTLGYATSCSRVTIQV